MPPFYPNPVPPAAQNGTGQGLFFPRELPASPSLSPLAQIHGAVLPESDPGLRIGFFGGSFDPPHRAHLMAARMARERFGLHRVLLAPTGRQPLKRGGATASFADRLAMVERLCADEPGLEASAIDGPRPDGSPNYTVDTLQRLQVALDIEHQPPPRIFALVGADAFVGMRQWREPDTLFRLADWIVVSRPGFAPEIEDLSRQLGLHPAQQAVVHPMPDLWEPVSATDLRERLHSGQNCRNLIPQGVLAYLERHNLYTG